MRYRRIRCRPRFLMTALAACLIASQAGQAQNFVAGSLFQLSGTQTVPNAAWCWFQDERAIVDASDPANPLLLISSVSAGSGAEAGDIDLLWRNLATGATGAFELANQLEQDDHDSASIFLRPDGRYLAMYSRHGSDSLTRWRVSLNPGDPTAWGPEQTLTNAAGATYNNTYALPAENGGSGLVYNFTRSVNYDPNLQVSTDQGTTWQRAGKLLTEGGGSDRPYVRYAASDDSIFVLTTDRHPRNFANSIYAGYVRDGKLYSMDGSLLDGNLTDATAVAPAALTPVFENGSQFGGTTMNRAWSVSLEVDNTGNPVGIFSARANDSDQDHRFFYARYDGAGWQVHELARAGGFLYAAENDYTGLAAVDPDNPNVVYVSSKLNPATAAATAKYELYRGVTTDFGESWEWSAVTSGSTVDNIRPVVPAWNGDQTVLTWMRGGYGSYTSWTTQAVGISFAETGPRSLLWVGETGSDGQAWGAEVGTGTWDSGGGALTAFRAGDEVAFDDSAAATALTIAETVTPMGVAFANRDQPYELTGAAIAGPGGLRVIGGGVVTLANSVNTFTGETLVARGTLAVAGASGLGGTSRITVGGDGVLDVRTASTGLSLRAGQELVNSGLVRGVLTAEAGSRLRLEAAGRVDGDLDLRGADVVAAGTVTGSLVAREGTLQVGDDGLEATRELVYVDATHGVGGNTALATGGVFTPTTNPDWQIRSPYGNGGIVYQGGSDSPSTAAMLATTVDGLVPGRAYHFYVNYWDATGSTWRILAGVDPTRLTLFDSPADTVTGAVDGIDPATVGGGAIPLLAEGNRTLWAGDLGFAIADEQGRVAVYIDDTGTVDGDDRTWYDGISYLSGPTGFSGQASLTVGGDLSLGPASRLRLDVATATTHDRMSIGGQAAFGGTLEVQAYDPSLFRPGASIDLFDFDTVASGFDQFALPALPGGLVWDSSDLYRTGSLTVQPRGFEPTLVLDVAGGTRTQAELGYARIHAASLLTKTGEGRLALTAANSAIGLTEVAAGTLEVAHPDALAASDVIVGSGAAVVVADGLGLSVASLALAPATAEASGGLVDLGSGSLSIRSGGFDAAALRTAVLAGRNGGGWDGNEGIRSTAAEALGGSRGVGFRIAADGSALLAFAAPGDVNLDGSFDAFDLVGINGAGGYLTGNAANWAEGDFTYDGVTNAFDLVAAVGSGTFGRGGYRETVSADVAAVPEPVVWSIIAAGVVAGAAGLKRRHRATRESA
jgi:autotransporter-associated beta strand protein